MGYLIRIRTIYSGRIVTLDHEVESLAAVERIKTEMKDNPNSEIVDIVDLSEW